MRDELIRINVTKIVEKIIQLARIVIKEIYMAFSRTQLIAYKEQLQIK
jgi:Mg2+/Co2+ transporter CorC